MDVREEIRWIKDALRNLETDIALLRTRIRLFVRSIEEEEELQHSPTAPAPPEGPQMNTP